MMGLSHTASRHLEFENVIECETCGSSSHGVLYSADLLGHEPLSLMQCRNCGLVFTSPRPIANSLAGWYQGNRWYEQPEDNSRYCGTIGRDATHLVETLRLHPGTLLDVGCGDGSFLSCMQARGWDVIGVELDEGGVRAAQLKGVRVSPVDFQDFKWDGPPFDLITFWHVLEHLPSPRKALWKAFELLSARGTLVVCVPNISSYQAQVFGASWYMLSLHAPHLFHFSPSCLASLLQLSGFRVQKTLPGIPFHSTESLKYSCSAAIRVAKPRLTEPKQLFRYLACHALFRSARLFCWFEDRMRQGGNMAVVACKPA